MHINPEKLLLSKWQSVTPKNKEKHFIVTELKRDEELLVTHCTLEAVLTKRKQLIEWQQLANTYTWKMGW